MVATRTRAMGSAVGVSVVAVLVALGATGCGGVGAARRTSGSDAPAPSVPRSAPITANRALQATLLRSVARTTAERSAYTSISVTLTGLGDDALARGAFDIAGTGRVDLRNGNADLAVTIPQFDRFGAGAIEQRIVGGVVYTRLPAAALRAAGVPAGISWLSVDPRRVGGNDPSALAQAQADPAGQLAFLAAASAEVRTVGPESVRGVSTTHYVATIDLDGRGALAAVRARLAPLGSAIGARPLTVDAWLDRSGCARRVVVSIPLSDEPAAGGLAGLGRDAMIRIQGDFYGFGPRVVVAAPPAGQVRPYAVLRLDALDG